MRTYYVRAKDLSHVPFQFYVHADGTALPLAQGHMSTFVILPPKDDFSEMHVHILADLASELDERWDIAEPDLIRVAAKAIEAWVRDDAVPADHFYGPGMIRLDRDWYPRETDGAPRIAADPYNFEVVSAEPWPSILDWQPAGSHDVQPAEPEPPACGPKIAFGFTLDVFPGPLILGYNQVKHKLAEAGVHASVSLTALADLPADVDVVFVPPELAEAARLAAPHAHVEALDNFLNHPGYNALVQDLAQSQAGGQPS